MNTKLSLFAALLAGTMTALTPARATTMVSLSMQQLTEASSNIVQAKVVSQASGWNAAHTEIMTVTTLTVSQTLKGNAGSPIEVRQLGGTVGPVTTSVMGDVAFRPQAEYILFLEPAGGADFHVVGMSQGAYPVFQDAASHQQRVLLPLNQTPLQKVVSGGGKPLGTVPLAGFQQYVAALASAPMRVPHGLNMPVAIAAAESRGTGRMHVYGTTTAQLFPSQTIIIPRGTELEGEAFLNPAGWTIHWDEVSVRGVHAGISATSREPQGDLRGRVVMVNVR